MLNRIHIYLFLIPIFAGLFVSCSSPAPEESHPFEEYLSTVHPSYSFKLEKTIEGAGYNTYVLRMISQNWLQPDVVDETEWWHWLTIVVPDSVEHSEALLWIGGGSRNTDIPESANPVIVNTALQTHSVTAEVHNVPFQPLTFLNDGRLNERYEDDLIAFGWRTYLEGGANDTDAVWLSRLPMTAAAMRAMDTITSFMHTEHHKTVDEFVVAGASKRGWTTWTTAIFDNRVIAIVPVVIDLLNIKPSFEHHWQVYGEWSPAIQEYVDEGIMNWQFSDEFGRMLTLVDPYSYIDQLDIPTFIINAASDEFFLPDSWKFYWEDLPGEKYIRYVPNTGHSISSTDASESLAAFYYDIINNQKTPGFTWSVETNGFQIGFDPENLPDELRLWNAHNSDARDFRLYVIDRIWVSKQIEVNPRGQQFIEIETPQNGYSAWFVEATFNNGSPFPLKQTSGTVITPDIYPFEPFAPQDSLGTISSHK